MINILKKIFGLGAKVDYQELIQNGAIVVDVRSKAEYLAGHIKDSINIPVDTLRNNLFKVKDKNQPIITCCASGMRSASAKSILKANGYTAVYNGGGWSSLKNKIGR
ncbi:rhodanese-like domain-containing protein [Flavobacterium petrolei]|uniref:Rhodanese-like domain-containing protein n=1 Tax=Flavobacterium petrolei TaxID=2259594 RepID=A0A482THE2_9FLAO|nr:MULTISPECIES: rhodanese-like domain-containing protein [Flavobacterium]QIH39758.1 rhodanese-like domain-containing protein [Flavobacterium sp. Sr18]RYJ51661.1 rhodanese-like domain-containing protein [Flavobacterium petrolei]